MVVFLFKHWCEETLEVFFCIITDDACIRHGPTHSIFLCFARVPDKFQVNHSNMSSSSTASSPSSAHKATYHGPGTQAKRWPNDLGDPKQHPLYGKCSSNQGALRALSSVIDKQGDNDGRMSPKGKLLPSLDEPMTMQLMHVHKGAPESAYARPEGYLNLSRSFFPDIKSMKQLPTFASKNIFIGPKTTQQEIADLCADMIAFMVLFKKFMSECCISKLQCEVITILRETPIRLADGSSINDIDTLKKRWRAEFPDKCMAEAMFHLLFKKIGTRRMDMLCYEICAEQRIWFSCSSDEHDMAKRGNKGTGPKRTMLATLMKTRFRDNYRKNYMNAPHGMTLNVNKVTLRRGQNLVCEYSTHLVGYDTDKHQKYLGTLGQHEVCSAVNISV